MLLAVRLLINAFGAYSLIGLIMAAYTAAQMLSHKDIVNSLASPWEQVLSLCAIVAVWPAVLLAMWDDNQDGPWRG